MSAGRFRLSDYEATGAKTRWQIGSKLFRQKEGIPQGSKISSMLCSIFYASLEAQHLPFVHRPGSVSLTPIHSAQEEDWRTWTDDFIAVTAVY